MLYPKPLQKLIEELMRLPGIGPKSAQRLALFILRQPKEEAENLICAVKEVKDRISYCSVCFNITESSPCGICGDETRDQSTVCVVEEPVDLIAFEKSGGYKGVYHILQGAINPLDGINPEDLRIAELLQRIKENKIKEVIIATNPNLEGETTALYMAKLIKNLGVKVTRVAYGLPVGAEIDYADEITLIRAIEGRREI